jgi:hypothetical protein
MTTCNCNYTPCICPLLASPGGLTSTPVHAQEAQPPVDPTLGVGGEFCVMNRRELQEIRGAWRLLRVLPSTVDLLEETYDGNSYNDPRYDDNRRRRPPVPVAGHLFLMHRSESAVMARLQQELSTERRERSESTQKLVFAQKELERVQEESRVAKSQVNNMRHDAELRARESASADERMRALELDLGKVRQEIGNAEYNRITGRK